MQISQGLVGNYPLVELVGDIWTKNHPKHMFSKSLLSVHLNRYATIMDDNDNDGHKPMSSKRADPNVEWCHGRGMCSGKDDVLF